jgi:hypothetical protein
MGYETLRSRLHEGGPGQDGKRIPKAISDSRKQMPHVVQELGSCDPRQA